MVGDYRVRFSNSRRCSVVSHDSSDDDSSSVEGETTSSMYSAGKEYMETEWTNEKHSLYLKSMETSFVDQLYSSLGALGKKENVSGTKPSQEQFKVLHDGFWQKINVKQPEHRINGRQGGGSHEFLRSPWIKHYKPLVKTQVSGSEMENQVVSNGKKGMVVCSSSSASSLKQICSHSRDHDQISVGEEVSDQNFVNEGAKGENGSSKKMKTVTSTDQVVPLNKLLEHDINLKSVS
ncbi:uncharacterized protein LOC17875743 isoform X2 [Capsella rubella]|uniref:uncharacterized protein LOC17875743 isoform X2 n=1 Tax=Capsella rubella TaxID=81985 RepID=UPI000CD572BC|nr:uncharacterized protein LOC17875743 isoform X2 [Capsella rubella]